SMVPHHPIVADPPLGLQAEDPLQFATARPPSVVVFLLRCGLRKASVVLQQILLLQVLVRGFIAGDLFPPQLLHQPILMHPVVSLHPSLGLRRTGGNDANPQLLTHYPSYTK